MGAKLDYFGARYYASDLSVWLSVDPMASKYPSMSPYMYCAGNPIMLIDPDGMDIDPASPGYAEATKKATPEYNKRGKQKNKDYQPAFAKQYNAWKEDHTILVQFNDDMSTSQAPNGGGTVEFVNTDNGGPDGAERDVYMVSWDPAITSELGTSGIFEESRHLEDALSGKFDLKSGATDFTLQNEYDAKEWVVNNITGIKSKYKYGNIFKATHYGHFLKNLDNPQKLMKQLTDGAPARAWPTDGTQEMTRYNVFGYGGDGYKKLKE